MRFRIAPIPLLAVLAAVPAAAQERPPVPDELARLLLVPDLSPAAGRQAIVRGKLPPEIPSALLPDGRVRVLGGVSHPVFARAVVTLAAAPEEAMGRWRAQLERDGWRADAVRSVSLGGAATANTLSLCGDGGAHLIAQALPAADGGSTLHVMMMGGERSPAFPSPCAGDAGSAAPDRAAAVHLLPPLRVPEGARGVGASGSGWGGSIEHVHASVLSTRPAAELAREYAAQLVGAGWTSKGSLSSGASAAVRLERTDEAGRAWHGLVAVTALSDGARDVTVRAVRAEEEPPVLPSPNAVVAPAAGRPGGTVPAELVNALVRRPFGSLGVLEDGEVVVGRLPARLPEGALPARMGAEVMGGVSQGDRSVAFAAVLDRREDALARYFAELERAGWRSLPVGGLLLPAGDAAGGVWCGPNGASVHAAARSRPGGGSYLRLEAGGNLGAGCRLDPSDLPAAVSLPPLRAPAAATVWSSGNQSLASFQRESSARVRTALAPAAVAEHYAAQLRAGGWTTAAPAAGGGVVLVAAERSEDGRTWRALIAVSTLAGGQQEVLVRAAAEEESWRPAPPSPVRSAD